MMAPSLFHGPTETCEQECCVSVAILLPPTGTQVFVANEFCSSRFDSTPMTEELLSSHTLVAQDLIT